MQVTNAVSFAEAAVMWISRRESRLSASTERAYRGEVDRLAQFFAVKYGGLALEEFTQDVWEAYLGELRGVRQHVVTCRERPLSSSSADQAIRITTAFLRWARDEQLLAWAPKPAGAMSRGKRSARKPLVDMSCAVEPMHPRLEGMLSNPPSQEASLEELRAQLCIGLAYWAGLRSSDIAALKIADIEISGAAVELRHPRLGTPSTVHGNVAAAWSRYRSARENAESILTSNSPVVAALASGEPVSAWSVWSLIAQCVEEVTGNESHHSAQSLRRSRVATIGSKCAAEIDELARYAHRANVDFLPAAATSSAASAYS